MPLEPDAASELVAEVPFVEATVRSGSTHKASVSSALFARTLVRASMALERHIVATKSVVRHIRIRKAVIERIILAVRPHREYVRWQHGAINGLKVDIAQLLLLEDVRADHGVVFDAATDVVATALLAAQRQKVLSLIR